MEEYFVGSCTDDVGRKYDVSWLEELGVAPQQLDDYDLRVYQVKVRDDKRGDD